MVPACGHPVNKRATATVFFPCHKPFNDAIIDTMEAPTVKFALGSLSHIEPRTFGEPGHRTFHLALEAGRAVATVWLEKEQLFQLGLGLQDALQSLSAEERDNPGGPVTPEWSGEELSLDFKAGQMSLVYDHESNSFRLTAYELQQEDSEISPEDASSVSFSITTTQAAKVAEEALHICSAGRPRCFLCGLPIDPEGHICPRSNGHTVFEAG